jgi:cytochrome c-type biogenesis protein
MGFLFISFIAGILTVLAPCVLPLLPVIIGGSLTNEGSLKRTYTIIGSLILSIVVFTLVLKVSTSFINIPAYVWQIISGGIIGFIGLTMVFPVIWEKFKFAQTMNVKSNQVLGEGYTKQSFWGDVVVGAALGPVFSSCSPTYFVILATVLPASFSKGLLYLLVYSVGLGCSLFIISRAGQKLMAKLGAASDSRGRVKKVIGVLFILVAVAILFGLDKKIQTSILDKGFFDVTKVEQKLNEGINSN